MRKVLILGGTREALELAALLHDRGLDVTTSLAGATTAPKRPTGALRIGGFGGVDGLAAFARGFDAIADATHPFAAQISAHAFAAASALRIPYVRLERPAWAPQEGDRWISVPSISAAVAAIPHGSRILLTTGRKDVAPFFARDDISGVARMIETPVCAIPDSFRLLKEKPPFTVEAERTLMASEAITLLVSKNAGGSLTRTKIDAARAEAIPVVMIDRPKKPDTITRETAQELAALIAP